MKAIRILGVLVSVVMLVGLVLGTACAGSEGEQGLAGVGIESIVNNGNGTFTLNLTDGSTYTTDDLTGPTGSAGVGIQSVLDNEDGTFTLNMTDGSGFTTPNLTGPKGDKGDTGEQGLQGEPGPNMIVAMGTIQEDGQVLEGYNIGGCVWSDYYSSYHITLTGVDYEWWNYVTLVTCWGIGKMAGFGHTVGNDLTVGIIDHTGNSVQAGFSFVVLEVPV